jgi:hypothetical protein
VTLADRYRRWMPLVLGVYVLLVAAGFLYMNMRLTVEWVAVILFVAALLSGRGLLFVRDWGVFILVLLGWQVVSGVATRFSLPWHLTEMIDADKLLFFGTVPSVWLQQHLYHSGVLEPWDVFSAVIYMLHFLAPLLAGFALWMANRALFRKFAITFVLVALAGFATYILYPAVPPWMAAQYLVHIHGQYLQPHWVYEHARWVAWPSGVRSFRPGHWNTNPQIGQVYLPGVLNLFNNIAGHWYNPYHGNISLGFLHAHYDQVGAIPSEHAMYPLLFLLFLRRQFGKIAYLGLIYIVALLFAITYMGQHYVVDAIVGFAYAGLGYALVMHGVPALQRLMVRRTTAFAPARVVTRTELEEV